MEKALETYEGLKTKFEKESLQLEKQITMIGYLRLLTFIIGLLVSIFTYMKRVYTITGIITLAWIVIFIYLIIRYDKAMEYKKRINALVDINKKGIARVTGNWKKFNDAGEEFIDGEHPFSGDLDLFGVGSLFQWINSASTFLGRKKLAKTLSSPLNKVEKIRERQKAIGELSKELEWRQLLNAEGMLITEKSKDPNKLIEWAEEKEDTFYGGGILIIINVLSAAFIASIVLLILEIISYKVVLVLFALNYLILKWNSISRVNLLNTIMTNKNGIKVYERIISLIENKSFSSEYANNLQSNFKINNMTASEAIKNLKNISDYVSDRNNMGYFIINLTLLWDYRCVIWLNRWKKNYGKSLRLWLETVGDFEEMSSFSNINYENPKWCIPSVEEKGFIVKAVDMGHPLLGDKRVCNSITIKEAGSVLLITGSNMSGKSTFLRTVGINIILSYCGAAVCALEFNTLTMELYTCMRISDNMEKSISSFYAEIIRIKEVVKAAKEKRRIFFLLDEIFKGTNSLDRHQGATMLIKQLSSEGASGLVSTHDLELGALENELPKVTNYHFQEYYKDDKLCFDYKINKGVSRTRNALHLMKLAGIDIDKQ